jgi:hypothetical protein
VAGVVGGEAEPIDDSELVVPRPSRAEFPLPRPAPWVPLVASIDVLSLFIDELPPLEWLVVSLLTVPLVDPLDVAGFGAA